MIEPASEQSFSASGWTAPDQTIADDLVVVYSTFQSVKDSTPRRHEKRWGDLRQMLTEHREAVGKDGECLSPTVYPPDAKRSNSAVSAVTLAVFDFDGITPDLGLLDGYEYVAHTTYSHAADDPHWRVVMPLVVPVPANDWPEARARMAFWLAPNADPVCKDLARVFYRPSCSPGADRDALRHGGRVLDWRDLKPIPQADADDVIGVAANGGGERPGDRFAAETGWSEILEPHGWELVRTSGAISYWRCPSSDKPIGGHCATTGYNGKDYLYVFCGAEDTPFEGQKAYSKFGAHAALEHGGNHGAAAAALAERYGMPWGSPTQNGVRSGRGRTFMRTDLGNAERLVARHGRVLRYCQSSKKWLVFDGQRWRMEAVAEVYRLAKDTVRQIWAEAYHANTEEERKQVASHAARSESEPRIKAMLALAEKEVDIPVTPEELDADPWLLNVANGTLDLRTGELREHRPEDLITKLVPVPYDPDVACPTWLRFLGRIMGGNHALVGFLQRAVGYALTGSTREQVLFLLYGTGANGKSTFLDALHALLADSAMQADFSTFLVTERDGVRNDLARLRGARLVSASEAGAGRGLSEVVVKQLTGGDRITARFLYGEFFEFTPSFKLFLAANHKPTIRGQDYGIWRRIRLIPFTETIPKEEQDRELPAKLRAELPGILAWAVQGCLAWQRDGLGEPEEVREATEEYRTEMDLLGDFIAAHAELDPNATVEASVLYFQYASWAEANGEKAMTKAMFGHRLSERGFRQCKVGRNSARGWGGLRLIPTTTHSDGGDDDPPSESGADTSGRADRSDGHFGKLPYIGPTPQSFPKTVEEVSAGKDLSAHRTVAGRVVAPLPATGQHDDWDENPPF